MFTRPLFFKIFTAWLMAFTACIALALPSPKDIETEIEAGNLSKAETMLREVIAQKPQSAKAHYELGQVLARQEKYGQAHEELVKSKEIDPSLKFASSPEKFNAVFDKVNQLHLATPVQQIQKGATPALNNPQTVNSGVNWSYVLYGVVGLLGIILIIRLLRPSTPTAPIQPPAYPPTNSDGSAVAQRGFGQQYTPGAQQAYGPPSAGGVGSGIGGAVIGGLAGVAAGYALSKAMEGDHSASSNVNTSQQGGAYVPFDSPAQPNLGSFDAGSGSDNWDDGSSSGGDDSW